jgi:hypothetical protein
VRKHATPVFGILIAHPVKFKYSRGLEEEPYSFFPLSNLSFEPRKSMSPDSAVPAHAAKIAALIGAKPSQVDATVKLLDEGNTVPFIARYRKEMTGSLDDEQVRIIADEIVRLRAIDERRAAILKPPSRNRAN